MTHTTVCQQNPNCGEPATWLRRSHGEFVALCDDHYRLLKRKPEDKKIGEEGDK